MKGILHKKENNWVVCWKDSLKSYNLLPLEPSINNDKFSDLVLVQILNVPVVELEGKEIDFDVIEVNENGCYPKYAKLIKSGEEIDWDQIEDEYYKEQYPPFGGPFTDALKPFEWLKLYYNIPIRKIKEMDIKNKSLIDLSPEAIAIRKNKKKKNRELAEKMWEEYFHEGDQYEREYWILGFIQGLNYNN